MERMTNEEYIANSGLNCPNCGSIIIIAEPVEVDGVSVWIPLHCKDCGATWNDVYTFTGYSELDVPVEEATQ